MKNLSTPLHSIHNLSDITNYLESSYNEVSDNGEETRINQIKEIGMERIEDPFTIGYRMRFFAILQLGQRKIDKWHLKMYNNKQYLYFTEEVKVEFPSQIGIFL